MEFNDDGSVTAVNKKDKPKEKELNKTIELFRKRLFPLIQFIQNDIFKGKAIMSQELVVNSKYNILALCDLSTDDTILEIKTGIVKSSEFKEQFYFEANGRKCYHLAMDWKTIPNKIVFTIYEVEATIEEALPYIGAEGYQDNRRIKALKELQNGLVSISFEVISYTGAKSPVKVKCTVCGTEKEVSYFQAMHKSVICDKCHPKATQTKVDLRKKYASIDERKNAAGIRYAEKINMLSGGKLVISDYHGSKENVTVKCKICGYTWSSRADHLLARCTCLKCKRTKPNGI